MINKILFLICILCFGMMSCEDEREIIKETSDIPDSIELIKANFHGQIVDNDQRPVHNASVKIMFENYLLGETKTNAEGNFNLVSQAAHAEKTYIVFEKEGYSPNIFSKKLTANEELEILPRLKALNINQSIGNEISDIQINEDIHVTIPAGLVSVIAPKAKMQYLDLIKESKQNILADLTAQDRITPEKVLWIDIVGPDNKSIPWVFGKEVIVTFGEKLKKELSKEYWFFDTHTARWLKQGSLSTDRQIRIKNSGFYAFINPCLTDEEKPVPYCKSTINAALTTIGTKVFAKDFDAGSYDNCDLSLDFKVRRLNDPCMFGDHIFKDFITLCSNDAGKIIDLVIKVTDDSNNADSVSVTVNVAGINPCPNDTTKPIPYCKNNVDISFSATGGKINAGYIDAGSYDNCTSSAALNFLMKKVQTDPCANGTNVLSPSLVFCSSEIGTSIEIETHVYDQNNNSDYCTVLVNIKP